MINLNAWGDMVIDPYVISHRTLTNFEKGLNQENFSEFCSRLSDNRDPAKAIHLLHDISEVNGVPAKTLKLDQGDPYMLRVSCYTIWFDDSGVFHREEEVRFSDRVLKKGFAPDQGEWDFMTYRKSYIPKESGPFVEYLPLTIYLLDDALVHQWWHRETKGAFIP